MHTSKRLPLIVGNWKMHMTVTEAIVLARELVAAIGEAHKAVEIGISPPFTALQAVSTIIREHPIVLCAQNCHFASHGAFTGEVSVPMLRDLGCQYVIVGHSERRQYFGENDALIGQKVLAAFEGGLRPILCVGENLAQRESGDTLAVIESQVLGALERAKQAKGLEHLVIAYEPVWAIGTGKTASGTQAQDVHQFIRKTLSSLLGQAAEQIRIQYGGSVKPANAAELMTEQDVDGALVGGASLSCDGFVGIVEEAVA